MTSRRTNASLQCATLVVAACLLLSALDVDAVFSYGQRNGVHQQQQRALMLRSNRPQLRSVRRPHRPMTMHAWRQKVGLARPLPSPGLAGPTTSNASNRRTFRPAPSPGLDWCEYWLSIGVVKDECLARYMEMNPPTEPPPPPTCTRRFLLKTCQFNDKCGARGQLCLDVVGSTCCHPPADQCPSEEQLNIKCEKTKPTNWCIENHHCGLGKLCCSTGCNYNMCV